MIEFMLAAVVAMPLEAQRCTNAVRTGSGDAVAACSAPHGGPDLWAGQGFPASCSTMMRAGVNVGRTRANLPPAMAAGLLADFDRRAATCQADMNLQAPPPGDRRNAVRLWD
jgi:hypothetical protein